MMLRRISIILVAALAATSVYAQTILQGGPVTPGHQPMYSGSGFTQPIVQDGGGSGGGALGVNPGEIGITSRSLTNTYPVVSGGNGPHGEHGCFYDAPTTNATGYHYLCLDPNAVGGGLIAYGAGGGASILPLYFNINGVQTIPGGTSNTIVVGSTAITGGSSGQILYNNAGALGAETLVPAANGGLGAASLSGLLVGNGASAATTITPGTGVATALAQAVSGSGGIILQNSPTIDGPTIDGVTVVGPNSTAGGFNYSQTFTGALSTFFPNNFTCNVNGVTGSFANSLWCVNIEANGNSGSNTAVPGGLSVANTLTTPSGSADGAFYVALGTLADAQTGDNGVHTTLTAGQSATASPQTTPATLAVTSIANFNSGDFVYVQLADGAWESTVVDGTPSGSSIVILPGLFSSVSNGGLIEDPKGNFTGGIIQAEADVKNSTPATELSAVLGAATAAYMKAGTTTFIRRALSVETDAPSAGTVTGWDEYIGLTAQTSLPGASVTTLPKYGIVCTDESGQFCLDSTGTIMKVGGVLASSTTGLPTSFTVANGFDFSSLVFTGSVISWRAQGTGQLFSISGAGFAYFANGQYTSQFPSLVFDDTHASVTTGGLQRLTGDGAGNYSYQINTAVAGDFSSSTAVYEVTAAGKFNIIQGLQAGGVAGVTCSGTPTSSFASNVGIVTHC